LRRDCEDCAAADPACTTSAYFGPVGDGQRRWCGDCCAMHPGAVDVREYAVLARLLVAVLKVEDTEATAEKAARRSEEDKAARVARKAAKDAARAAAMGGDQPSGGAAEGARAAGLPGGPAAARAIGAAAAAPAPAMTAPSRSSGKRKRDPTANRGVVVSPDRAGSPQAAETPVVAERGKRQRRVPSRFDADEAAAKPQHGSAPAHAVAAGGTTAPAAPRESSSTKRGRGCSQGAGGPAKRRK
jgi:hypothetical protein